MVNKVSLQVYEIIEKARKSKTRKEKIEVLQKHECWALKDILRGTYDEIVVWNLPPGTPPYEPAKEESVPSTLHRQHKKIANFVKGLAGDKISGVKRERLFIDMLEVIHPADAELLINMKDKENIGGGITKKLVQEAFPKLIIK
jgi:hypothetical protein